MYVFEDEDEDEDGSTSANVLDLHTEHLSLESKDRLSAPSLLADVG